MLESLKIKRELEQDLAELKNNYERFKKIADGTRKNYFTIVELKNCGIKLSNPYGITVEPDGMIKRKCWYVDNLLPDRVEWRIVNSTLECYGNERLLSDGTKLIKLAPRYFWSRDNVAKYIRDQIYKLQDNIEMRERFIAEDLKCLENEYGYKLVRETE